MYKKGLALIYNGSYAIKPVVSSIGIQLDKVLFDWFGLVWFLLFNGISTFVGYLLPKPFS